MKRLFCILSLVVALSLTNVSPVQGASLPQSAYVTGLIGHAQSYSLSCESRSAADFAAFWDVTIGETEFLESLPRSDDPDEGFVGNPNDAWGGIPPFSYGVHADPVAETLQDFGLDADARDGLRWDDLRAEIAGGRPVIVWVIGAMWGGTPREYRSQAGNLTTVAPFEHTMILTGYNEAAVEVVDAGSGWYLYYDLNTFLKSWEVLGNMAVFGPQETGSSEESVGEDSRGAETAKQTQTSPYTVKNGDYLIALARRFGINWLTLAKMNSISFPFIIHPGQELLLPHIKAPKPETGSSQLDPAIQVLKFREILPIVQNGFIATNSPPGSDTQAVKVP